MQAPKGAMRPCRRRGVRAMYRLFQSQCHLRVCTIHSYEPSMCLASLTFTLRTLYSDYARPLQVYDRLASKEKGQVSPCTLSHGRIARRQQCRQRSLTGDAPGIGRNTTERAFTTRRDRDYKQRYSELRGGSRAWTGKERPLPVLQGWHLVFHLERL